MIFSGGFGVITKGIWTKPEADQFAQIAVDMGVHYTDILEYLVGEIDQVYGMSAVVDVWWLRKRTRVRGPTADQRDSTISA